MKVPPSVSQCLIKFHKTYIPQNVMTYKKNIKLCTKPDSIPLPCVSGFPEVSNMSLQHNSSKNLVSLPLPIYPTNNSISKIVEKICYASHMKSFFKLSKHCFDALLHSCSQLKGYKNIFCQDAYRNMY